MRIFLGIDLPEEVKKELGRLIEKMEKKHWKVKWERTEKLHLTLAFLGELKAQSVKCKTSVQKLKLIEKAVSGGCWGIKPFLITFKGWGVFPDYEYPRVIWLGLKGDLKGLAALQKAIENKLIEQGFEIEKRKFTGHLTLGRLRPVTFSERKEISRQLQKMREIDFKKEIVVDKVTIFESKLSPKGSTYKKLAEFCLKLPEV